MTLEYNKKNGQFYTKDKFIKRFYNVERIKKFNSVLEPSFGSGVLFIEYIKFLIIEGFALKEISLIVRKSILIEIDKNAFEIGKKKILEFLSRKKIKTNPSFYNKNFFELNIKKIDLILINPPYIRRRNINEKMLKKIPNKLKNNVRGNYDIYIFFLEWIRIKINFKKMVAIIPQSYLDAKYAKENRKLLKKKISSVYLFKKPVEFDRTKYTIVIMCFENNLKKEINFLLDWKLTKNNFLKSRIINMVAKNGVATLSNYFFVLNDSFECDNMYIRKGVWGSGNKKPVFFPYDKENNYKVIEWSKLKKNNIILYNYLWAKKKYLKKLNSQFPKNLGYGRSQFVKDVDCSCEKYLISTFLKKKGGNKIIKLNQGEIPMSGIVIYDKKEKIKKEINKLIKNGHAKNGNYVQISTKNFKGLKNEKY